MGVAGPKSWVTGWHWRERILNFEPSWFTICMGTGVVQQMLVNFPYPIGGGTWWMRNLAYCFWILDIVLFGLFAAMLAVRYISHPELLKKNLMEFPACSYLGAIPIALDTVIVGIVSFYDYRTSARWVAFAFYWVAFAFYWVAVALTLLVSFGLLTLQTLSQKQHSISDVAGLWLMTSVPLIVTAAAGSTLLPYLGATSQRAAVVVLVVSFLLWSLGMCQVHLILAVYFWRLISHKLPAQQLLASGFLPLAPLGQGAYAIQQMSIFLANYLKSSGYAPTQSQPPPLPQPILLATAEAMHWLGILLNLFLLAHASFWLVQAVASVAYSRPKSFNIGMWSFTFPWGSYANAWSFLGRDLRNSGMRGWAATNIVIVILIWLLCAGMTSWLGFWKGSLFSAPGLEEWLDEKEQDGQGDGHENGTGHENGATKKRKKGAQGKGNEKKHNADGTYTMDASRVSDVENGMSGHANGNDRQVDGEDSIRARRNGNG